MNRLSCSVSILLLAAGLVGPLGAQQAPDSTAPRSDSAQAAGPMTVLSTLKPGTPLQVTAPGLWVQNGHFLSVEQGILVVEEEAQRREVELGAIQSLHIQGSSLRSGLIRGALGGLGMGLGMGWIQGARSCDPFVDTCWRVEVGSALLGAGIGALLGGSVGAFAGSRTQSWQRRFP